MRPTLLLFFLCFTLYGIAQSPEKILVSSIVISSDSLPVPDVAIINVRNGKTVRTNSNGYFEIEMNVNDSLLAYHIAYKKRFINKNDNAKKIILEPEVQELLQIDILDNTDSQEKKMDKLEKDIMKVAPLKKLEGYNPKVALQSFIDKNGSHNKAFSPYFGPTFHLSTSQIVSKISKMSEKRKLKRLTSHYHIVKKKDQKK